MSLRDEQQKYERWWVGKRARRLFDFGAFREVTRVEVIGPPSGFTCIVEVFFEHGERELIGPPPKGGFKPRKGDLEVEETEGKEP